MFYESLIILNISTLNFSEGVPASVLPLVHVDIEKPDHLTPISNMYLVLQLLLPCFYRVEEDEATIV